MRTLLEDFYTGNLRPAERQMAPNSDLRRAVGRISRCEQQLRKQLDEAGQRHLTTLTEAQHEIDGITACENFILGFRLGVRMMAECMDEDDGDTRKVEDVGEETPE